MGGLRTRPGRNEVTRYGTRRLWHESCSAWLRRQALRRLAIDVPRAGKAQPARREPRSSSARPMIVADSTPDGEQALVNARYRLIETIGQGGMGAVWRGHDEILDREVAIKRVLFDPDLDDGERAELTALALQEARATARLSHPGIVTIHDVIDDGGAPVIVMELIDGRSLADLLREEVRLPFRRVAEIGVAVLDALREAHAAGIVHRDLKPANVLITDRRVVITDFGVAQRVGERADDAEEVLGTPAFMAPEQVENAAASPAGDLWSLGATLFNAVEGTPPFQGPDQGTVLLTLLTQEAPAPVHAGPLAPLITALLRKDPERRPNAEEVAERLDAILRQNDGAPTAGTPAIAPPASGRPAITPPPDAGGTAAAPPVPTPPVPASPGSEKAHGAKPVGGTPASSGAAPAGAGSSASAPAVAPPAPKPTVSPGAAPSRPRYVRPDSPWPPAHVPLSGGQRARRAVAGPLIVLVSFLLLYACVHTDPSDGSPTGVVPSPSDSFEVLPSIPPPTPSSPPDDLPSPGPAAYFDKTAFSPDGRLVAFGGDSGVVRVYDTASHELLRRWKASTESYLDTYALAFSPDGRILAVDTGGPVTLWDIHGHKHHQLDEFGDASDTLQFSADGHTLTALGLGGKFATWNVDTGKQTAAGAISLPSDNDSCGTGLSSNGRYAVCGYSSFVGNDEGVIVWDIENNREVASWPDAPSVSGLALSPDGGTVVFSDEENTTLQLWDVASHLQTGSLPVEVPASNAHALAFSPDGARLVVPAYSSGEDETDIEVWNVSKEKKVLTLRRAADRLSTVAFGPDGDKLVVANEHNGVLWDARSGKKLATWKA